MVFLKHRISMFEYDIPEGFSDSSYGNDMCPSIANDDLDLQIFIDAKDPEDREESSYARFSVIHASEYGECGNTLFESESFEDVLVYIDQVRSELGGSKR